MSNDYGSVHEDYPVGPIVWIGICIDCKQKWSMTESEKQWWDQHISAGMTFPKRCKSCRDKKRRNSPSYTKSINTLGEVARKLEEMSMAAVNDMYDERGDFLAQELADLAKVLREEK